MPVGGTIEITKWCSRWDEHQRFQGHGQRMREDRLEEVAKDDFEIVIEASTGLPVERNVF